MVCPKDGVLTVPGGVLADGAGAPLVGEEFAGRYELEQVLGIGGMCVVYRAREMQSSVAVAVKLIRLDRKGSELVSKRFRREARIISRLNHPNIVELLDYGTDHRHGAAYHVLELIEGRSLRQILASGPIAPKRAYQVAVQALGALEEAHSHGIVHRDLKPGNVMLTEVGAERDFVKILDFGVALVIDDGDEDMGRLTESGATVGSPMYMAPEQVVHGPVTGQTDLYALGAIVYEMIAGRPPFICRSRRHYLAAHLHAPIERPRVEDSALAQRLLDFALRCLAKHPEDRPAGATEALRYLETWDRSLFVGADVPAVVVEDGLGLILPGSRHDNAATQTLPESLSVRAFGDSGIGSRDSGGGDATPIGAPGSWIGIPNEVMDSSPEVLSESPGALAVPIREGMSWAQRAMIAAMFMVALGLLTLVLLRAFTEPEDPNLLGITVAHQATASAPAVRPTAPVQPPLEANSPGAALDPNRLDPARPAAAQVEPHKVVEPDEVVELEPDEVAAGESDHEPAELDAENAPNDPQEVEELQLDAAWAQEAPEEVDIRTQPPNALVHLGKELIGRSPLSIQVPREGVTIKVTLPGHRSEKVRLRADDGARTITLDRARQRRRTSMQRKPRPAKPHNSQPATKKKPRRYEMLP